MVYIRCYMVQYKKFNSIFKYPKKQTKKTAEIPIQTLPKMLQDSYSTSTVSVQSLKITNGVFNVWTDERTNKQTYILDHQSKWESKKTRWSFNFQIDGIPWTQCKLQPLQQMHIQMNSWTYKRKRKKENQMKPSAWPQALDICSDQFYISYSNNVTA